MTEAYDSFAVFAEQSAASQGSREKQANRAALKEAWDKAAACAVQKMEVAAILEFGALLRDRDAGFWLEVLECHLARDHYLVDVLHLGFYQPWNARSAGRVFRQMESWGLVP